MSTELETRPRKPDAPAPTRTTRPENDLEPEATAVDEIPQLEDRIRPSARWFHWVAGLSVINSIIVLAGGNGSFLFGLGATRFVDGIVLLAIEEDPGSALIARVLGLGINLMIAAGYVLFGWLAGRSRTWVFALGMSFYALDGMIVLSQQEFLGLAFHGAVLFILFRGLRASIRRGLLERS